MTERKSKLRYNYEFLQQYCDENKIVLKKDYSKEKVVRDTIIEAKCVNCDNDCIKNFRLMLSIGCFCKIHTNENRNEKVKKTCLEKYGFENPFQN